MSDEPIEPSTPSCPSRVPPNHAESRHGHIAPHPPATDDSWGNIGRRSEDVLAMARYLFRTTRNPMADATYGRLRPDLLVYEAILEKVLRNDPSDPVASTMLQEVRRYLGREVR